MNASTDSLTTAESLPALPAAWPDRPGAFWRIWKKLLGFGLSRVELPEGLSLRVPLPKYLLQEFHNLPNGNYSHAVTDAYCTGFDRFMLGEMDSARAELARALGHCDEVLDVGCGAGGSTAAIKTAGAKAVVGLDASPYMLVHARRRNPGLQFVQGLAEDTRLEAGRFDGIGACFLFHELPPKFADAALREFKRLMKPGGRLVILEPAREQMCAGPFALFRRFGWRGVWFWGLARSVNEPFIALWHQRNVPEWLQSHGFKLVEDRLLFPSRLIVAEL